MKNLRIKNPHDLLFKSAMKNKKVATEFFQEYLPPKLLQAVDLGSLALSSASFVKPDLSEKYSDVLYSVKYLGKHGYLYLLSEHQSRPEKWMPLRILEYKLEIMREHLKQNKDKTLPLVIVIVFYNGREPYLYSQDIFDLFSEEHKELARENLFSPFHLIDVNKIDDNTLKERVWSGMMGYMMKHARDRQILKSLRAVVSELSEIHKSSDTEYFISLMAYLLNFREAAEKDQIFRLLETTIPNIEDNTMRTIADAYREEGYQLGIDRGRSEGLSQGISQGRSEGLAQGLSKGMSQGLSKGMSQGLSKGMSQGLSKGISQGLSKGRTETRKMIARKMFQEGLELELIVKLTQVPKSEIVKLQEGETT